MKVRGGTYTYYDLKEAEKNGLDGISRLPRSLKVLLENLLRHEDGKTVKKEDIQAITDWLGPKTMVDYFGTKDSYKKNVKREYERNGERYDFLKWGQTAFDNFAVVPPGTGICHQVNLENLAQTVWTQRMAKHMPSQTRLSGQILTQP